MQTQNPPDKVQLSEGLGPANEVQPLVERLRTRPTGDPYLHMMVHEAADEIERLTRLNLAALSFMRGLCADMPDSFNATVAEWDRLHPDRRMGA